MADMVRRMAAAGATPEAIAIAVETLEAAAPSKGALRTRRWREKKEASVTERHETSQNVTDASPEASQNVTPSPTPPLLSSLSVEPLKEERKKGSLESGRARAKRVPKPWKKDEQFCAWYAKYPRHEAPVDAHKAYRVAIDQGLATDAQLTAGRDRYVQQVAGSEQKFIKLPATWIRAGCWDDHTEPIVVQASSDDDDLPIWARNATPEFKQRYRETEKTRKANGQAG